MNQMHNATGTIIDRMKAATDERKIESTPSFLINNKDIIRGGQDFETFQKLIDSLLKSDG